MNQSGIPRDLHPTQYGHKLLENIGLPPITSNVKLMGDCIASIAKANKIRPDEAYVWLWKRCQRAKEDGDKLNYLWFSNGEYNDIRMSPPVRSTFVEIDEKSLAAEQQTPGYQEAKAKLYQAFERIAGKKAMTK